MNACGVPVTRRIAFAACGSKYYVIRSKDQPEVHRLAAKTCHDRFCRVCGNERSRCIATNVRTFLKGMPCRFVTLTLRNDGQPLSALLDKLYGAFKALRASKLWRKTQTGGVAFLEVKRSAKTGLWHPHLHVLSQGKYLQQAQLSTLWNTITGDSHIVDIRLVRDQASAVAYVTKYASKPMDQTLFTDQTLLCEAIHALKSRRLITTFGKWRGLTLSNKPDHDKWEKVCTLDELAAKAADGDTESLRILKALTGEWAPRWITAARTADSRPRAPDDVDLHELDWVDTDTIPF